MSFTINQEHIMIMLAVLPITWFWTTNNFITAFIDIVYGSWLAKNGQESRWYPIAEHFYTLITCMKCTTFWLTLSLTWNPVVALFGAMIGSKTQVS